MVDRVRVAQRQAPSMASILARRGASPMAIGEALAIVMPVGPTSAAGERLVVIGTGPETWLAVGEEGGPGWCAGLQQRLAGLASVSDQTGAYRLFHFNGPDARTLLQRGANIDLDFLAFPAGAVALTVIGHVDVIVRCLEEGVSYDVAVYRSYTDSLLRWVDATLAGLAR